MAKWNHKGLTPEEREKRKEALRKQVEGIINNFENSPEDIVEYLKFNSKFHQYSSNNTMLIYEQNNFAQFCASYKSFQDMGYQVQKGQTGMKIFVPYITTVFHDPESDQWIKLSEGTKEQKALVKAGQLESKQYTSFGIGTVFDIGQTDCPPEDYPKLFDMGFASETHQRLYHALVNYAESQNISVEEKFLPSISTRGYYQRSDNSITLSDKLNDSMKLSVMSHELSHAIMHGDEMATQLPQLQKEIEADSLSLMIRQHLGITDVEDIRQDHLKSAYKKYVKMIEEDNGNTDYPDLSKILDNVNKAYNGIIDDFDKSISNYLELHQETVQKLTLNEYLGLQGLASPYSDYMIDKVKIPRGLTQRQQNKHDKQALEANEEYHTRRDAAIKEYNEKVASGEIIPPTNVERYIKAAKGHPDNKSTQAAIRVLTKRGYIQDSNGNWIKSTEVISQNKKDFKQTIDDFLNGNINPTDQIFVCQTTEVMRVCGADNLDVMIYQDTIRKILSDDFSKFEHPHNLTVDTLKQLPDQLQKPVMVFKGSHEGSIVLVTDLFNENSEQIIISCELDSGSQWNKINRITSMYGKENIANYLNTQITKGNLIGCHKKVANQMLHSVGLYLPSENTFIDYTDIISNFDKNVNRNNLTNEERIMEDKIYAPETTIYFEDQKIFDELTTNPNIRYHFHNHYFGNIKFTDKNIIGHLGKCTFNRCTFENFNGNNIDLSESSFRNCKIINSSFENSSFYNTGINYSQILNSNFSHADFFLAEIRDSALAGNNFSGVTFSKADLIDVHINNSIINEPIQNLTAEQITLHGATHKEVELHRAHIFEDLKLELVSFEQIVEQSKASLEPLPEIGQNNTETNSKQIKFKILPADSVTEYLYNVQVHFKYEFTDEFVYSGIGRFCKNLDEVDKYINKIENDYSKDGYTFSYEGRDKAVQKQHYDMLKTIAEYEQELNVSPEERIVEMNYNTAHWQPKDNITPKQVEELYNGIINEQNQNLSNENTLNAQLEEANELAIKFNGDYWSIVDKSTQKELALPTGDTTSEILHIIAHECPEYREFINNNFDKLIDDIARAEQSISDEAISVEHDRLSAAISQGGFGEDMADSAAYQKLQHLENLMSASDDVLENNVEPKIVAKFSEQDTNNTIVKNVKADAELQATINNQLEEANELPIDVLCDDGKIQWYSFLSGINNTEKVKELLQNIQRDTKQIVSIYQNSDEYQLVHLNNDLQIIPYSDNVYPDADAALKAVMENDNIAKLVPYEDMLQASVTQDLTALSECDNNKYPYIKINWSDNSELTQEGYLTFDKAEDLFRNINDVNQDKGTIDKTSISLFLNNQNTYNLDLNLGSESGGIAKHLNQLINENDICSDKSLQHLQEYLRENGLLAEQEFQSEQAEQRDLFDFAEMI